MNFIKEIFYKFIAHKHGLKVNSFKKFKKNCNIKIEVPSRLGGITVESTQLNIGTRTYIRSKSECLHISEIGRYCSIGRNVILGQDPRNHPVDWATTSPQFSKNYQSPTVSLRIGHDVWIGHRATIMAGIEIGHGAIIGCDAVVTKNVPPYAIVAGNPAKLIRFRFNEETISQLLKINWWHAPFEYLCKLDFSDIQAVIASLERYEKFKPEYLTIRGKKIIKTREKL